MAELNRTYLFAPGNHARKVEKVFDSGCDVVILDLEDAVAVAEKVSTRAAIVQALKNPRQCRGYVRVNAIDTSFCFDDIEVTVGPWLDGICLPKVESAADLLRADWLISNLERRVGLPKASIDLLPIIETAKGMGAIREITTGTKRLKRVCFGAGDYTRDLGLIWTFEEKELAAARAELVLASRIAEIEPPIDTVFIHIRENTAFSESTKLGREFGFQGKLCIHPDQVSIANDIYTPTHDDVIWATKIIANFKQAEADGSASIQVDGYFVDYPIVEKAQRILDIADAIASQA